MVVKDAVRDASAFSLNVAALVKGATYRLQRCTNLPFDETTVEVASAIAGDGPLILTDTGVPSPLPAPRAFYRVVEER